MIGKETGNDQKKIGKDLWSVLMPHSMACVLVLKLAPESQKWSFHFFLSTAFRCEFFFYIYMYIYSYKNVYPLAKCYKQRGSYGDSI